MSEDESGVVMEAAAPAEQNTQVQQPQQDKNEQMVPLSALQAERQARQSLQDEVKAIRENMELWARQHHQQPQPQPEVADELDDEDVLTVGQFKKAMAPARAKLAEMQMYRKYPDYEEVILKHLPKVIEQQPGLRNTLQQTQDYELAYYLAKNSDSYRSMQIEAQKAAQPKVHPDAERIIANSEQPGSLSSVPKSSSLSEAKRWSQMSEAEFRKRAAMHLA